MSNPIGGISSGISSSALDTGAKQIPVLQDKSASGTSFGDTLTGFINNVSDSQDVAADYAQRFARGEPVELHQVMASAEEASISLEMLVQIRNKFQDAYKSLTSMQS